MTLETEKAFHNKRFDGGDSRTAQLKYYWAIQSGSEKYYEKISELAAGADVLDYGCSVGNASARLKEHCRSLTGIDISEVAIEIARAKMGGGNASFSVMDAMKMSFPDESFDLVFGSGIIHHLDTGKAVSEVHRVLRSGGQAIFWEPLGLNPMINLYRLLTPKARTPDEHPLLPADFRNMHRVFTTVHIEFFGFATLIAVPLRDTSLGEASRRLLQSFDEIVGRIPFLQFLCWYGLIELQK
jgi:SAM-dependent methyltransferase